MIFSTHIFISELRSIMYLLYLEFEFLNLPPGYVVPRELWLIYT